MQPGTNLKHMFVLPRAYKNQKPSHVAPRKFVVALCFLRTLGAREGRETPKSEGMPSSALSLSLLALTAILHPCAAEQKILQKEAPTCPETPYNVHLVSQDPLVVYLENFLLPNEAQHLQDVS